jgi:hypothetical protein
VIKKWQEQQQLKGGSPAAINWDSISQDLNKMGDGDAPLSPSACQILWKYLAYGQVLTEADLLEAKPTGSTASSSSSSTPAPDHHKQVNETNRNEIVVYLPCQSKLCINVLKFVF